MGALIELPFPPASLSGHNNKHFWLIRPITNEHREWAKLATLEAKPAVPEEGDIPLHIRFHAPDNRGDRCNYWNRCKAYIDGIAEAMKVNDRRFLPSKSFGPNEKPGRVVVIIGSEE